MGQLGHFAAPGDEYLWHRNVTGVNLNVHQMLYMDCFNKNPRVLLKGSRRIRKSFAVAAHFIKQAATKPFSEINVFAPAIEQSKRNIRYMTNMVLQSPLLNRFVERRSGGVAIGAESITFRNGSVIQAKGQASSVDGLGSTHIWLEEFDDMDWEATQTRILPTGAQLKDRYDYGEIGQCQIIVTGTIKGQFNLWRLEHPDPDVPVGATYVTAPVFDVCDGIEMGIIPEDYVEAQRYQMTVEQFARTYLCLYTESKNFFPTRYLKQCLATHVNGIEISCHRPVRTGRYKPFGFVTVGMDFAGQGSKEGKSSNTTAIFLDFIRPGLALVLHAEEFGPLVPPQDVKARMRELLGYYRPTGGIGDSYDATLIHGICEEAYRLGLTKKNPQSYKHGEGIEGWQSWYIIPTIYSGPRKHQMYMRTQRAVYERGLLHPPIVRDPDHPSRTVEKLLNQMEGMVAIPTQGAGYDKYEPANKILGDDLVDALVGAYEFGEANRKGYRPFGGAAGGVGDFTDPVFHTPVFHEPRFAKDSRLGG